MAGHINMGARREKTSWHRKHGIRALAAKAAEAQATPLPDMGQHFHVCAFPLTDQPRAQRTIPRGLIPMTRDSISTGQLCRQFSTNANLTVAGSRRIVWPF